ncbi:hypothetical protein IVB30_43005 [Bradyrhizobium sp. 200]|uniref:hypothetical protein n=1 Tax=Bradyrhizobium sp. 200 TaxID=2782665 RepID=UPI0020001067|nr:hypothetical protein [Bradyrhizobium sp. 200]UPJ49597.1 hypothetical protein IVB30_43005 [Bradyrhizobium sp. 200]
MPVRLPLWRDVARTRACDRRDVGMQRDDFIRLGLQKDRLLSFDVKEVRVAIDPGTNLFIRDQYRSREVFTGNKLDAMQRLPALDLRHATPLVLYVLCITYELERHAARAAKRSIPRHKPPAQSVSKRDSATRTA